MSGVGGGERIRWTRQVRLPAALTAAQLAVWPLGPVAYGAPVDSARAWQLTAVAVVVGVALSLRAVAPVAVWTVILIAVSCADPLGLQDEALVVPFTDLIALYSVAVRRTLRVSVLCAAAGTVLSTLVTDVLTESDIVAGSVAVTAAADAALYAAAYAAVVVFGRARRRRTARHEAVRVHVAGAAEPERAAAAGERERLSQELHDVSAHHLTAVVVQLAAAQRLRDPVMTAQALDVARTSGQAAARSLHRLAALAGRDEPPSPAGLPDLVAGFDRLGLRVELRHDPDGDRLHPDVAEAVHLIVQESLTNVLRYAPGAAVTVAVTRSGDTVTVAVDDTGKGPGGETDGDASGDGAGGFDLGSGAGIPGMRARAGRLRGTLRAGPRPAGGWSVRAVLPVSPDPVRSTPAMPVSGVPVPGVPAPGVPAPGVPASAARAPSARAPMARAASWWRSPEASVLDALLIVLVAGLPLFLAAAVRAEEGGEPLFTGPSDAALTALFLIVYCGPLWWRRRAPVAVLAALVAVGVAGAVLGRGGATPTCLGIVVPLALAGIVVPVYAVGRYDTRHPGLTWLAAVGAGAGAAVALTARFLQPADLAGDGTPAQLWPAGAVFVTAMSAGALSLLALPWWLAGFLVARHHARADRRDRVALRDVAERPCAPPARNGPASPRGFAGRCCRTRRRCSPPQAARTTGLPAVHPAKTGSRPPSVTRGRRSPRCGSCSPC
ncbi:histidine kinase [Dactylosporangium sp. NBC_01737]|uniref:sensor histidine kinase n=1 Tax=Dactylosporangium sp. NBC_01737 TaxID=2975959 RepID=UPI002E0F67CC|nr:histidine kinase [Dactylosporangium sp. NBC_01737]